MKQITLSLAAFLIVVAAGCNNTDQPLTAPSTGEQRSLSKEKERYIWVREGTNFNEGTIYVNGQRYDIADGATIQIPLNGVRNRAFLWECIWTIDHYECRWDGYSVESGGRYVIVDGEPPFDMTLIPE